MKILGAIHRVDTRAEILDRHFCELFIVLGFICRWQHGDFSRFHYEQDALSSNESIGCFILCISLVIRYWRIKKNSYFSALTKNLTI